MKNEISKVEAAERQLTSAIRMYFWEDEIISVHTLACAAFGILKDLIRHSGKSTIVDDYIKSQYLRDFWRKFNKPSNFFKHADNDPNASIAFPGGRFTELVILLSCKYLVEIKGGSDRLINIFILWQSIKTPDLVGDPSPIKKICLEGNNIISKYSETEQLEFARAMIHNPYILMS